MKKFPLMFIPGSWKPLQAGGRVSSKAHKIPFSPPGLQNSRQHAGTHSSAAFSLQD